MDKNTEFEDDLELAHGWALKAVKEIEGLQRIYDCMPADYASQRIEAVRRHLERVSVRLHWAEADANLDFSDA